MALPRPCIDCGQIARAARCDDCKKRYNKQQELKRPTRSQRGYDYAWRKISKQLRAEQPWCSNCGRTNDLTVDHIHPLADGGMTIRSNLQVLCRKCNSSKGDT